MMKGQKGITLVALVITIIVMLILVGVSLTFILDDGLPQKATNAAEQHNAAQVSEQAELSNAATAINAYL